MTPESAVHLFRQALLTAAWISAPLLLLAFVVGIAINLIQIVTSLQDSAFSTIPRLLVFLIGFVLLMPWMMNRMMSYTVQLISDMARHAR
ncbi:MAG TPA: flagellar biosynthetic protein FliQ [Bryobacteraceae bacterium]|nr:flagellar biosynthetic protein FliQ [Bryobacteraceae bacterium]